MDNINQENLCTEPGNQNDLLLKYNSDRSPITQDIQQDTKRDYTLDPFVFNRQTKTENIIQLNKINNYGSDDILDYFDKQPNSSSTPQKVVSTGRIASKSKHHHHSTPNKNNRKSQIYPDPLFLDSQQHHQYQSKAIRVRVICRVQQFAMTLLYLVTSARDRFSTIMKRKDYFNQVGDKSAFFNGILFANQNTKLPKQIKHAQKKQNLSEFSRGAPSFRQKQSIRILQKPISNSRIRKTISTLKNQIKRIPLINQQSIFRRIWDIIHMIVLLYYFTFIPLLISFNKTLYDIVNSELLNLILVILLLFDIIWNFNTTLIKQGKEITSRKYIIIYYLKNGFIIDVVTLISLILFLYLKEMNNTHQSEQSLSVFLLAFYLRYKQFGRVAKKVQLQYYFSSKASQVLRLFKLLFYNIYIIHTVSCLWIFIARNQSDINDSWMGKYGVVDEPCTVTMVTVGYGDISPATSLEKIFSVITILSGCGVFAYSISEVGSIFKKMNEEYEQKKDNMIIINGYMKKKKIPVNLQCQIRHYLEYYWNESLSEKVQKEQQIIDQLSNTLKESLKIEANRSLIQESPFFKNIFSEKTLNKIVQISTEQRCHPEEVVYRQGERDSSIFFIEKGSVQCVYYPFAESEFKQNGQSINLKSKQYFGDVEFLTGEKRMQQVRSLEFTTLIKIDREKFIQIIKENDKDHQKFCMLRDELLLNKNYSSIQLKCSYCFYCKDDLTWDSDHFEQNCPLFHFIPNRRKLIYSFMQDPMQLERQTFKRRQVIKFKIYKNLESISKNYERFIKKQKSQVEIYVQDHCLLNETVFTDEDLSDSVYTSDDSQSDSVIEELSSSQSLRSSQNSDSSSQSESESEKENGKETVEKQDSFNINKTHQKQKSILSNKIQGYNKKSTLEQFDTQQEKNLQPSIADMVFDDFQNNADDGVSQGVNSFFTKAMKKNSTIKFNVDNNAYAGYDTINLDEQEQVQKEKENIISPQIIPNDAIKEQQREQLQFIPQNLINNKSEGQSIISTEIPQFSKKQSLKSSMSVKFKLPPVETQKINKGKTLSQVEHLYIKKQSTIKKDQKKGQNNGKSLFFQEKSNKVDKNENILQIKKQNKYLQKFINLVKSSSLNRTKSIQNNDNSKHIRSLKTLSQADPSNLNRFYSQTNGDSELITQTTLKDSAHQSFFSGDKKEQIGQKIKVHMLKLQEGFQQIQEQLTQYNTQFLINSNVDPYQGYNIYEMYQFQQEFEKMKDYTTYFPHNNYTKVIQHYSEVQYSYKRKMYRLKKKSQTPKENKPRLSVRYIKKIQSHIN